MDRIIKPLALVLLLATAAFGAEKITTPVTFNTGASLTIASGVHVTGAAGSIWDMTGATLTGFGFQPADPDLTYLASFSLTANVKAILNASDYAAIRTLMGLGTMALQANTGSTTAALFGNGTGGVRAATAGEVFTFTDPGYNFIPYYVTATDWAEARFDTDGTLAGNSATRIPTQNAVKTYADGKVSNTAYDATTWNGVTDTAPSKDAVRDALVAIVAGSGSGGTVTNFSAGDLSPLFTTTETMTDTTPDLEFALTAAPAHTFFGNATGSSAVPIYFSTNNALAMLSLTSNDKPTFANLYLGTSVLTYAATTTIDFGGDGVKTVSLTGNVTFATSNLAVGRPKTIRVVCDGTDRTMIFPASWTFVGAAAPAMILANKTGILSLLSFSTTDASVIAQWVAQP